MSCEDYRDAIIELGRGREGPAASTGLLEHLGGCGSCAALLERQRALTAGLRALSAATRSDGPSEQLEARLLSAFDETHGQPSRYRPGNGGPRPGRWWQSRWLPAAAAVLLAAAGFTWWQAGGSVFETGRRATGSSKVVPAPPGEPGRNASAGRGREGATPGARPPGDSQAAAKSLPAAAGPGGGPQARAATLRRAGGQPRPAPRPVVAEGFLPLPWSATLPDFDRGEIVRTEIPVTALPLYGIAVVPDAPGGAVQADLLIAQDGQARAIRLVANEPSF
jgi:hypothetical protein